MAQELLLLVCQASAEESVTTFLVNWCNRLASLSTPSSVLALPMRRVADLGLSDSATGSSVNEKRRYSDETHSAPEGGEPVERAGINCIDRIKHASADKPGVE
jgi:hypothetical protein